MHTLQYFELFLGSWAKSRVLSGQLVHVEQECLAPRAHQLTAYLYLLLRLVERVEVRYVPFHRYPHLRVGTQTAGEHVLEDVIAEVTEEACREQPKVRHDAGIDQIYITEWIYNGLSVTGDLFISE